MFEFVDDSGYYSPLKGTFLEGTIADGMVRSVVQYAGGFIELLRDRAADRHERFGGSVYLLEPEVKNGPGGIRDLDVAIRLNPASSDAFFNRGSAWNLKGESGRAIADLDEAIRLGNMSLEAFETRAEVRARHGDPEGARADREQADRIRPANSSKAQP